MRLFNKMQELVPNREAVPICEGAMPRYKPKTQAEIEAMTDQRLFNAHWWKAIIRHDDMVFVLSQQRPSVLPCETDRYLAGPPVPYYL
jgi:hypothetical protein